MVSGNDWLLGRAVLEPDRAEDWLDELLDLLWTEEVGEVELPALDPLPSIGATLTAPDSWVTVFPDIDSPVSALISGLGRPAEGALWSAETDALFPELNMCLFRLRRCCALRMGMLGPRSKLSRAIEHQADLEAACAAYLAKEPVFVQAEFEEQAGCFVIRLRHRKDENTHRLSTIVGDLVHNLCSALDHAVWLMACETTPLETLWKPGVASQIAFPVASDPAAFAKHRTMAYLDESARRALEQLQVYSARPEAKAIAQMQRFWRVDKHRVITAALILVDTWQLTYRPAAISMDLLERGTEFESTYDFASGRLAPGTEVGRVRFKARAPREPWEAKVEITQGPTFRLAFRAGQEAITVEALQETCQHFARALTELEEAVSDSVDRRQ